MIYLDVGSGLPLPAPPGTSVDLSHISKGISKKFAFLKGLRKIKLFPVGYIRTLIFFFFIL